MKSRLADRSDEHVNELTARFAPTRETGTDGERDPWRQDFRTPGMHDRDRILYCSAFQRLAYVTQVTAPEAGFTFHNRLSHSLKVAQIGRRNAERLKQLAGEDGPLTGAAARLASTLDADAVEACCLAHDLGHPPFGHIAEEVLQEKAAEQQVHDRFEGNAQSFRIVTRLAQRASARSGLDLTRQTLDGLLKYPWKHWNVDPLRKRERKWGYYSEDAEAFRWVRSHQPDETSVTLPLQSIEAAIMEWADDLTYAVHDVDDFWRAGLVPLERLGEKKSDEIKHFESLLRRLDAEEPGSLDASVDEILETAAILFPGRVPNGPYRHRRSDRREMRALGSGLISDYLSAFMLENDSHVLGSVNLRIDDSVRREVATLNALVKVYVIRRPGLAVVQHGQKRVVADLFDWYLAASKQEGGDRRLFPPEPRDLLDREPDALERRVRIVIDLIAGLTEESAIQLHRRLIGGAAAPTLDATAQMV